MAVSDPSESKNRQFLVLGVIVFVVVLIYNIWTKGALGARAVIEGIMKIMIWVFILIIIAYGIFKIFFEKKEINLVANERQAIINAGLLCKPPLLRDLYFTGDKEHGEAKIGTLVGFCQIQSYTRASDGKAVPEDCFIFKTSGFPANLFEEPKVFRCFQHEHSELIGDVKIYAISPVEKYGYYFPNHAYLDVKRIDKSVIMEAYRGQIHEVFKDLASITKKASGLDSDQNKAIENRKLLKIPNSMGEQESRQG